MCGNCFCKINPLLCISPKKGTVIVGLLDIAIGLITLYFSCIALYHFKDAITYLDGKYDTDVAWFGMISIPLVGLIGVWSGLKLLQNVSSKETHLPSSAHIFKFFVFFIFEVAGFVFPFFYFDDYLKKIERIHENKPILEGKYTIYRLLEVNPVTIGLFVYQIYSFWIVHRYRVLEGRRNPQYQNMPLPVQQRSAPHMTVEMTRMIPEQNVYCSEPQTTLRTTTTKTNGRRTNTNRRQQRTAGDLKSPRGQRSQMSHSQISYPDLEAMRGEMATLPSFARLNMTVKSAVLDIDGEDQDTMLVKRKPLTDFEQLKRRYEDPDDLFEDEEFLPNARSLGSGRTSGIRWLRPFEINENARFFTDGFDRFDVKQGALGDCWFIASVANLTLNKKYFNHVVPADNEWADGGIYSGICRFKFFKDGKWNEVTVDDRLPTRQGKLIYMHSSDATEFWSALLEKAYAKFTGSYAALNGSDGMGKGMRHLTGGTISRYRLSDYRQSPNILYGKMCDALEERHLIGICATGGAETEGILGRHAYSVTHISKIMFHSGRKFSCVRIRNPWGNGKEWKGEFSDGHEIWKLVDKKTRKDLEVKYADDGEFWIPLAEVFKAFEFVEICYVTPRVPT